MRKHHTYYTAILESQTLVQYWTMATKPGYRIRTEPTVLPPRGGGKEKKKIKNQPSHYAPMVSCLSLSAFRERWCYETVLEYGVGNACIHADYFLGGRV